MQGVILAGGIGSRLWPITHIINKHLLPVWDQPMIHYPIQTLIKSGISDIIIVTNPHDEPDFRKIIGNGSRLNIQYVLQKKPGGIAEALGLTEKVIKNKFLCILGDNILPLANFKKALVAFQKDTSRAKIFLKKVKNPRPYGIAEISRSRITQIIEKPHEPKSNLAVIGVYLYTKSVFDVIKKVRPSHRNEMEITCVNNYYVENKLMDYEIITDSWIDAGESLESLYSASQLVKKLK